MSYCINRNFLRATRGIMPPTPYPPHIALRGVFSNRGVNSGTSNVAERQPIVPELRLRDTFSFAHQIAKGMQYLSDMKVSF